MFPSTTRNKSAIVFRQINAVNFIVAFQYRRSSRVYLVKAERDDIFVAFPRKERRKEEPIFLTKAAGTWVGDNDDKLLVQKIGGEIDALYLPERKRRST